MNNVAGGRRLAKRISFFWSQGEANAPDFVKRCWAAWSSLNPDYDIAISDDRALEHLFQNGALNHLPPTLQARSDIFRLYDVATKGGLYVDCGTIPMVPVGDWLAEWGREGFFAFHDPRRNRPLENWFIYAETGNPIATAFLDASLDYWRMERRIQLFRSETKDTVRGAVARALASLEFVRRRRRILISEDRGMADGVARDMGGRFPVYPYFWQQAVFEDLLRRNANVRECWARMPKVPSYKAQMIRHWRPKYRSMSEEDVRSLIEGSIVQKVFVQDPPPDWVVDMMFKASLDNNRTRP